MKHDCKGKRIDVIEVLSTKVRVKHKSTKNNSENDIHKVIKKIFGLSVAEDGRVRNRLLSGRISHVLVLLVEKIQILFVLLLVPPHHSCLRVERRVVVGLGKERLNGEQDRSNVVERTPLFLEDI